MCNAKKNLENVTSVGLLLFVGALQISIAISAILLTITLLLWLVLIIREKELPEFPIIFWPLLAYAAITLQVHHCAGSVTTIHVGHNGLLGIAQHLTTHTP